MGGVVGSTAKYSEKQVLTILRKFMKERIHGGDFDQCQSVEDTVSVAERWWLENKTKIRMDMLGE